ncbi:MAG: hypothetical protein IPL27_26180 [Lewinellaceae bacterium]|nr:hypothetical protein [Lewinellaceae bacterium]
MSLASHNPPSYNGYNRSPYGPSSPSDITELEAPIPETGSIPSLLPLNELADRKLFQDVDLEGMYLKHRPAKILT